MKLVETGKLDPACLPVGHVDRKQNIMNKASFERMLQILVASEAKWISADAAIEAFKVALAWYELRDACEQSLLALARLSFPNANAEYFEDDGIGYKAHQAVRAALAKAKELET